jgi:hypothetical protein
MPVVVGAGQILFMAEAPVLVVPQADLRSAAMEWLQTKAA